MIRIAALIALLMALPELASAQGGDERDALIEKLKKRIEALEKEKAAGARAAAAPADAEDEELERALERTLVQQGGLVLRANTYEIEPQLSYAHWDKSRTVLRHEADAALTFRAGLPWDSQFQLRLPYAHVATATDSTSALGDVSLALSKQLRRESGSWPGLVASLGWVSRTGQDGFGGSAPTGSGFDVLQGGITAVKRHDPLVFYGGLSYAAPLSRDVSGSRISPGDIVGLRLGSILAASPDTSVNLALNLNFVGTTRIDGQGVPESSNTLGTLQIGFGFVLTRRLMLNLAAETRVTGIVPDYRLSASLPIRF